MYRFFIQTLNYKRRSKLSINDILSANKWWMEIPVGTQLILKRPIRIPAHCSQIVLVQKRYGTHKKKLYINTKPQKKDRILKKGILLTVTQLDKDGTKGVCLDNGVYLTCETVCKIADCKEHSGLNNIKTIIRLKNPELSDAFEIKYPAIGLQ